MIQISTSITAVKAEPVCVDMLQHTYVWYILYQRMSNQSSNISLERVFILVNVNVHMCIPRVGKGILGPRTIYSHTEVSLRYFYLMDYYLISMGTDISIYTRPMSLAPTIDHISRFNVSRIRKSSRREVKK